MRTAIDAHSSWHNNDRCHQENPADLRVHARNSVASFAFVKLLCFRVYVYIYATSPEYGFGEMMGGEDGWMIFGKRAEGIKVGKTLPLLLFPDPKLQNKKTSTHTALNFPPHLIPSPQE